MPSRAAMPASVRKSTVIGCQLPLLGVIMKVIDFVPLLPSTTGATEAAASVGVASSSMIVAIPSALAIVALTGVDKRTVNVSFVSLIVSPTTLTVTVFEVSLGA